MSLPSTLHVFDPRPEFPFLVTARRYIPPRPSAAGCTLVFAHGTGYHKELWEPCLERIFEVAGSKGYPIREAWSLDAPGHGDAGILNATVLRSGYSVLCNWQDYGRAINLFLTQFEDGYFRGHYLIGIGHSMGAVALILAVTFKPMLHFESVVLCDPMMYSQEIDEGPFIRKTVGGFVEGGKRRRDIWPSKKDALEGFLKRPAFQRWNRKALEIYCEHGLVELPTLNYPDKSGVTLKCFKDHERACYEDDSGKAHAFTYLSTLCAQSEVHVIYGDANDLVPREANESVMCASEGKLASIQRVDGAGHLLVLTHPIQLADHISTCLLRHRSPSGVSQSKL